MRRRIPNHCLWYPHDCMAGVVLDGKKVSREIQDELRPRIAALSAKKRPPALAVVLVGDDPASQIYVRNKIRTCHDLGIRSVELLQPSSVTTQELIGLMQPMVHDDSIDGILVQQPLPKHIDSDAVNALIDYSKDVDGFGVNSLGRLVLNEPAPRACTPVGIMEMLNRYRIPVAGKHAVVV